MFSPLSGKHTQRPQHVDGPAQDGQTLASQTASLAAPSQLIGLAQSLNSSPTVTAQLRLAEQLNAGGRIGPTTQRAKRKDEEELGQRSETEGKLTQRAKSKDEEEPGQRSETEGKLTQRWLSSDAAPAPQAKSEEPTAAQRKPNQTGLPDGLKAGIEGLSGVSLDGVRVHRNSDKPAALQAAAYTQGPDIHVAPGQEQHLPHEAWHVVQQQQGRVPATSQVGGVAINDDPGLEAEATAMGAAALSHGDRALSQAPATQAKALPAAAGAALRDDADTAQRQSSPVAQRFKTEDDAREWITKSSGLKLEENEYTIMFFRDRTGNCHGYTFEKDLNKVLPITSVDGILSEYKTKRGNDFPITIFMSGDLVAHSAVFHDDKCQHKLGTQGPLVRCAADVMARAAGYDRIYKLPEDLAEFSRGAKNQNLDHYDVKFAFEQYMRSLWYVDDLGLPEESEIPVALDRLFNESLSSELGSPELSAAIVKIKHELNLKKLNLQGK
jgi:hypothetical protein